jgi:hypothetical protein
MIKPPSHSFDNVDYEKNQQDDTPQRHLLFLRSFSFQSIQPVCIALRSGFNPGKPFPVIPDSVPHRSHFHPDIVHAGYQGIQFGLDYGVCRRIVPGILPSVKEQTDQ